MSTMPRGAYRSEEPTALDAPILALLYRCHFATTDHLIRWLWHRPASSGLRSRLVLPLRRLKQRDLVWQSARRLTPGYRSHRSGMASGGWFYGLTDRGKLAVLEHDASLRHVQTLTREGYLSESGRRTILHSTHATEWCVQLATALRTSPYLAGMWLELESTLLGRHLRMDGLVRLRLWTTPHAVATTEPRWAVPWLPTLRTPLGPGMIDATFALEIDEGTEQLEIITGKARNYARTYAGHDVQWPSVLCPEALPSDTNLMPWFPIPVFITTSDQRLANLRAAWRVGWPNAEVRFTTWAHINQAPKFLKTPYLNHEGVWVDLMGLPL